MSEDSLRDKGSPSDRFFSFKSVDTTSNQAPTDNRFQAPSTSDLSQALGNMQNAAGTSAQYYPRPLPPTHPLYGYDYNSGLLQTTIPNPLLEGQSLYVDPSNVGSHSSLIRKRSQRSEPPEKHVHMSKITHWSPEYDAILIKLRAKRMKWEDIAKSVPGKSSTACRLRYQNYLEVDKEWSEEQKNKLAESYDKQKEEMFGEIAQIMKCSIDEVEAVHWQLGEEEMAERAGKVAFSLRKKPVKHQNPSH